LMDARVKPGHDEGVRHTSAFSRRVAPEVCQVISFDPPMEGAGNAGRAMRPQPRM
jgi:hypothetical protein